MFCIVELTEISKIIIISSKWFCNPQETRIEIPILEMELGEIYPRLLNLNEISVKKSFDCIVIKKNIETYDKALQMLNNMLSCSGKKRKLSENPENPAKKINGLFLNSNIVQFLKN